MPPAAAAREAAAEIGSSVPWFGFPVGYAVSGILLTVFGYFAMILAQQRCWRCRQLLAASITTWSAGL